MIPVTLPEMVVLTHPEIVIDGGHLDIHVRAIPTGERDAREIVIASHVSPEEAEQICREWKRSCLEGRREPARADS